MSDFRRIVDLAKRQVTSHSVEHPQQAAPASVRDPIASLIKANDDFHAKLNGQLQRLEASSESFDLRSDLQRTPFRKVLVTVFNRLFSIGGLARHLGSTQKKANTAALTALRLMQKHLEEQDRQLIRIHEMLDQRAPNKPPENTGS